MPCRFSFSGHLFVVYLVADFFKPSGNCFSEEGRRESTTSDLLSFTGGCESKEELPANVFGINPFPCMTRGTPHIRPFSVSSFQFLADPMLPNFPWKMYNITSAGQSRRSPRIDVFFFDQLGDTVKRPLDFIRNPASHVPPNLPFLGVPAFLYAILKGDQTI